MELTELNVDVAVVSLQQYTCLSLFGDCATVLGCKGKNDSALSFVMFNYSRLQWSR